MKRRDFIKTAAAGAAALPTAGAAAAQQKKPAKYHLRYAPHLTIVA